MKLDSAIVVNRTGSEVRVAVLRGGEAISVAVERGDEGGVVGNLYQGRVLRIVPGMQSAFVDVGLDRAAFLFGGDVMIPPTVEAASDDEDTVVEARIVLGDGAGLSGEWENNAALPSGDPRDPETTLRPGANRPRFATRSDRPRIESLLQTGQEILVQASKDSIGTKGARLTTQIALPGRFLVYMPFSDHVGVSRRITDESERERLRGLADQLKGPGEGFIVRTVCEGVSSELLAADATSLRQLWTEVKATRDSVRPPALVHSEADVVLRTVRDVFSEDIGRFLLDDAGDYERVLDFVQRFLPDMADRIELYEEAAPIFEVTGVERLIGRALGSKVRLPSGGYLVIEGTEALTSVDVNSGRHTSGKDLEDTILTVNLEAAKVVVEQLRLRDIGGIIVVDFIDMGEEEHRALVNEAVAEAMAADPARASMIPLSEFGLLQMTRRRVREDLARNLLSDCAHCGGSGRTKSPETVGYAILREIRRNAGAGDGSVRELVVRCSSDVATWIIEVEQATLDTYSAILGSPVRVVSESGFLRDRFAVSFQVRGRERA
jgi:ribonuclease G